MSQEYKSNIENKQGLLAKSPMILVILALLTGVGGFGLGKITSLTESKTPVRIEGVTSTNTPTIEKEGSAKAEARSEVGSSEPVSMSSGQFVASKNGKKYFTVTCSGAKTIKEENRIYFASQEAAKSAGYEASVTCKDLQ
jgi:hypothetical protein